MPSVTLITAESGNCPQCEIAGDELQSYGIPFIKHPASRENLKKLTNKTFYPQIMYDGKVIDINELQDMFEPLTMSEKRYCLFPIKFPDLYGLFKKAVASFWTVEEIDLKEDLVQWVDLREEERFFITRILAFFAGSDGIVMENLMENFQSEITIPEARHFYAYQSYSEAVHSETYSLLIDTYVKDTQQKLELFDAVKTIPTVEKKAKWAMQWLDPQKASLAERLVAFACVEGILFSGAFCSIFWLKQRGILPGLCFSNELISRDEALHCEFALAMWEHVRSKPSQSEVHEIVQQAVRVEEEFIVEAIPVSLIGMDGQRMKTYIHFVADRLLKQLGFEPLWNAQNPFPWMENIGMEGKTNFFEKRVGEYSKHDSSGQISFEEEF